MLEATHPPAADDAQSAQTLDLEDLRAALLALLLAAEQPLSLDQLGRLLADDAPLDRRSVRAVLAHLGDWLGAWPVQLVEVASGYVIEIRPEHRARVARLWQEKPPKLSRALLETLAIICYQQPVTRGEIEDIRGVALSPSILRTLLERGWVKEVGVKEVPGRPALFGTTPRLLDDLGLKALSELPELPALKDPEALEAALARLEGRLMQTPSGSPEAAEPAHG